MKMVPKLLLLFLLLLVIKQDPTSVLLSYRIKFIPYQNSQVHHLNGQLLHLHVYKLTNNQLRINQ